MFDPKKIDHHCSWDFATHVQEICQPAVSNLGLEYFDYSRAYNDGGAVLLYNHRQWVHTMLNDSMFAPPTEVLPSGQYIWDQYIPEHFMRMMKNDFNFDHGLTFIREQQGYQEIFNLGATPGNTRIIEMALNAPEVLFAFVDHFIERADGLIQKSVQDKLHPIETSLGIDAYLAKSDSWGDKPYISEFLDALGIDLKNLFVYVDGRKISLTSREAESLYYLCQGYTAKEIARELSISYRTVEIYIKNIREKAGCHCVQKLVANIENKKVFLFVVKQLIQPAK